METLEQIALRLSMELQLATELMCGDYEYGISEFSRRLVAELAKQEPVGFLFIPNNEFLFPYEVEPIGFKEHPETYVPLYLHPIPTPEDVRDAAKWREHESKKKALIERGFLKSPLRDAAMTAAQEGK